MGFGKDKTMQLQPPVVIHEKSRENQSRDVAAIIAANAKSSSVLSSVWLRRRENHFRTEPAHILIYGVITGVATAVIAIIAGVSFWYSIGGGAFAMEFAFVAFLITVYRNADTLEYEVIYNADEKETAQNADVRVTYRIETKKDNRITFRDFPATFNDVHVAALLQLSKDGERFNVKTLPKYGVCTQPEYPALRDALANSNMLEKNGKSWELTDEFFAFANESAPPPAPPIS